ncbi:Uncharacterised protein [Legionella lansingensis]|uniref:Uncharacterized protein n=1 Tax=Legionella lansingensis TaxID=45067 RepID=A0A0W0VLM2_9GAMM|nr:hypothetical protein [Legionella lansingensis]KTD20999.1 hypothetical protein Llan_1729 [Legionella lansingensis]SNV44885.1 Uncharacterised protein [Legionella lansingensis]
MGFYFNTPDQINGDKAYNEGKFDEALTYYSHALETLLRHAASSDQHLQYYDAIAHVFADIIITKSVLIRINARDFTKVAMYWREILSMIQEMEVVYNQNLKDRKHIYSREVIIKAYSMLAVTCEKVSDKIMDYLDDSGTTSKNILVNQPTLSDAIQWMQNAIIYQIKSGQSIKIDSSCGYLNLLERQFKETNDEQTLALMSAYMAEHRLLEQVIEDPMQKLELLSYAIRIAIVTKQDNLAVLTTTCHEIYQSLPRENDDNPILQDLSTLIELEPRNPSLEDQHGIEKLEEEEGILSPTEMSLETPHPDDENLGQIELHPSTTSPIPTAPMPNEQVARASQQGMFAITKGIPSAPDTLENHSHAFITALDRITKRSGDTKYLANLLSLVADFFKDYQSSGIPKKNCILIAFDAYQQVLRIYPEHRRAMQQLGHLPQLHPQLVIPYQQFGSTPLNHRDPRMKVMEPKSFFIEALEEITTQVETLLIHSPQDATTTLDRLIHYLGAKLAEGVITHRPYPEIRDKLVMAYQEELNKKSPSSILS